MAQIDTVERAITLIKSQIETKSGFADDEVGARVQKSPFFAVLIMSLVRQRSIVASGWQGGGSHLRADLDAEGGR